MVHRSKMIYPNLPDDFRALVRKARIQKGLSQHQLGEALGYGSPASAVSQFETANRNFSYAKAVAFRDYLEMDYSLPYPSKENTPPITRNRKKAKPTETKAFHIIVDGELIEVVAYRRLGPVTKARVINQD